MYCAGKVHGKPWTTQNGSLYRQAYLVREGPTRHIVARCLVCLSLLSLHYETSKTNFDEDFILTYELCIHH